MKKGIIIFIAVIITISLLTFSMMNNDNQESLNFKDLASNTEIVEKKKEDLITEFDFSIGPRFSPITISDLNKATSISDFITPESFNSIVDLKSVNVIIIENERQTNKQEIGYTKNLTNKQLQLLKATDYSLQFNIRSEFTARNTETGQLEDKFDSPHYSVVPEKQAIYSKGKASLIKYLINNTKDVRVNIVPEKIQPAMLRFMVTKNGIVKNPKFDRSSKNPDIDKKTIELILNMPGTWMPAKNAKGENVNQELVVRFYIKGMGC